MIAGHTRVYGVIADPIAHVRSPEVMNAYFAQHGADAVMVPLHLTAADLATGWEGLRALRNLGGLIVTVPHKTAVVGLCDEVGDAARQVGAANAVRREADGRLVCDMFDGKGFLDGLLSEGLDPAGQRVLMVGAGGAASAIAFALAGRGATRITIANRTPEKAEVLAARVAEAYPACDVASGAPNPAGHGMVINATSLGLRPEDPLPIDAERLTPQMIVAEIVMKPERTPLIAAAESKGCRAHLGRHMLDSQVRLLAAFIGAVEDPTRTSPNIQTISNGRTS